MDAKLVKVNDAYSIIIDGKHVAFANESLVNYASQEFRDNLLGKLSLKNCEAIANGYDLDELAENEVRYMRRGDERLQRWYGFVDGFEKALEILVDKKFTFDQMLLVAGYAVALSTRSKSNPSIDIKQEILDFIDKMEQTEWEVEIEMEEKYGWNLHSSPPDKEFSHLEPKLDSYGCLILKRKI